MPFDPIPGSSGTFERMRAETDASRWRNRHPDPQPRYDAADTIAASLIAAKLAGVGRHTYDDDEDGEGGGTGKLTWFGIFRAWLVMKIIKVIAGLMMLVVIGVAVFIGAFIVAWATNTATPSQMFHNLGFSGTPCLNSHGCSSVIEQPKPTDVGQTPLVRPSWCDNKSIWKDISPSGLALCNNNTDNK